MGGLEEMPGEISQAHKDQGKVIGGRGSQLSDIVKMLQTASSERHTFICIDAMDECAVEHRAKLLDSLDQILQKSSGTRIFVTGRPHIQTEIGRRFPGKIATIAIIPRRGDIIGYLRTRLKEDTDPDAMDSSLEADILRKIPKDISEMYVEAMKLRYLKVSADRYMSRFLLVSLNIDAILQETTIHRKRQRLNAMTDGLGLGDAYGATLDRIKGQGGEKARLGMATLMWISHAEWPLEADELLHALAVEIGSPDLNSDNIPSIGTLLSCCQGLVVVDKEASTVRLIHFTLQEYLRAHPELFGAAHSTIAEICLSYLNSQQVKAISTLLSPDLQSLPFLDYCSLYWGVHAKRDLSNCAKQLALNLFDDCSNHIATKIILRAQRWDYYYNVGLNDPSLFSGLHWASIFGIDEIVAGLVELGDCDINQEDCVGNTPLVWAASNGHEGVVKILLGRDDVNPDKPDRSDRTPLWCAASNGHEGVVKILLGRDDVNPDKPEEGGQTPLYCAASNGHKGVVKILLGREDINPDKPEEDGQTPLIAAAEGGHEGVVRMLLGRDDVNPEKPGKFGQTPLCWAAGNGDKGMVKILLGRDDVDPDKPGEDGRTPLYCAARNGHEGVAKILLGRDDVNPERRDVSGQTPLHCAVKNEHEGVVRILLGRDDVNPQMPDEFGQTPLCWAAKNGHEGVVEILLERDDVDLNWLGEWGQPPLSLAAEYGHEGAVKILLGRDDVDPDKPDEYGRTPLCWAASNGHERVVEILVGRDDVNPERPDIFGQTPLCCAAKEGHERVVKILLGRDGINPNKPDNKGQTPLSWAVKRGHAGVVVLLQPPASATPSTT